VRIVRTVLALLFSLLFSSMVAVADGVPAPILVEPPDPTSATPITLVVTEVDTCPPKPIVTRAGFTITVTLGYGPCLSPPSLITYRLEIGTLPPGNYTAVVTDTGDIVGNTTFTVLDANLTVRVGPSLGSIEGGTVVDVFTNINHCAQPQPCTPPAITFDGIAATNLAVIGDAHYRATTPPHAAGPVDVRVASASFTQSSFAFRYYDPAEAPLPEFFERILIPVIYNGAGAFGSQWATEVSLRNDNAHFLETWRGQSLFSAISPGKPLTLSTTVSAPTGIFLIVPRDGAAGLKLNVLIRDVSRANVAWGTEIPVVRENDFSLDPIELLNVPLSRDFRRTLRIYSLSSIPHLVLLKMYSMETGQQLAQKFITLTSETPCRVVVPCASDRPSSAMFDLDQLFPNSGTAGRAGITIDRYVGPPAWGFVSVTNNETQHVTVISPQ
jgi:hypothetical protein